jgi:hypothetical protein
VTTPCGPPRWLVELYEPTPVVQRDLVRYQGLHRGYACQPLRRHEARVKLDEIQLGVESAQRIWDPGSEGVSVNDPRWPRYCMGAACPAEGGYVFGHDDQRWIYGIRLMGRLGGGVGRAEGEVVRLDCLPAGALYRSREDGLPLALERLEGRPTCIGEHFMLVTPDGPMWLSRTFADRAGARFVVETNTSSGAITLRLLEGPVPPWTICDGYLVPSEML